MFRNICLFVSVLSSSGSLIKRILSAMFFLYFFKLYLSAKGSSLQILCELLWIYLYLRNYDTLKCLTEERIGGGILFFLKFTNLTHVIKTPYLILFWIFSSHSSQFYEKHVKKISSFNKFYIVLFRTLLNRTAEYLK